MGGLALSEPWLIFDTNYLFYRAYYAMGQLRHGEDLTGPVFGVFRDILHLSDMFQTKRIVFCFDLGPGLRRNVCPGYKANRTPMPEEFTRQLTRLRTKYLPAIGYRNIFAEQGYEADDLIATTCEDLKAEDKIIISNDGDLFQLLDSNTMIFKPTGARPVTAKSFTKEWGVLPGQWPLVKAIAGCKTDNIDGVDGVAEKTAAKYVANRIMGQGTKSVQKIIAHKRRWQANLPLVTLPYPGTPTFVVRPDAVTPARWAAVADRLGMASIRNLPEPMRAAGFGLNDGKRRRP